MKKDQKRKLLYLFLISQRINRGWDVYQSAVVCAASAKKARFIHPSSIEDTDLSLSVYGRDRINTSHYKWDKKIEAWTEWEPKCRKCQRRGIKKEADEGALNEWCHPKEVNVKKIGIARKGIKEGTIICAYYLGG